MRRFFSYLESQRYALLRTPEDGREDMGSTFNFNKTAAWSTVQVLLLCLCSSIVAGGIGFLGGKHLSSSQTDSEGALGGLSGV